MGRALRGGVDRRGARLRVPRGVRGRAGQAPGSRVPMEQPGHGTVHALRFPHAPRGAPASIRRPAPLLGQHTAEVLRELGYARGRDQPPGQVRRRRASALDWPIAGRAYRSHHAVPPVSPRSRPRPRDSAGSAPRRSDGRAPSCRALNSPANAYCTDCGASLAEAGGGQADPGPARVHAEVSRREDHAHARGARRRA